LTQVYGTFIGRWYVTVLGIVFIWRASRHLGWRNTALYVGAAVGVGALAENASVHFGLPYTRYVFNSALRSKELVVGDVPLMVPLSYTFLGYFGFAAGRMLASGPYATRGDAHGRNTSWASYWRSGPYGSWTRCPGSASTGS
jgi:uncharacterized membrane protein